MQLSGRTISFGLAGMAALLVLSLWPRPVTSPEDEIRLLVRKCVQAAEDKKISVIADALDEGFKGPNGASRDEVKGIITFQVMRSSETVAVFNPTLSVTMDGDSAAKISGKFVFARAKAETVEALPAGGVVSAYQIDASLKKRDGKWQFVAATYSQLYSERK